jgi:hypothetical protein
VIGRLQQDLTEFKHLWRQECDSRRSAERQADQLRAELLRLIRMTMTSPTTRRPTPAPSAIRAATERGRALSLATTKTHRAASRPTPLDKALEPKPARKISGRYSGPHGVQHWL